MEFSNEQLERYSRHMVLDGIGKDGHTDQWYRHRGQGQAGWLRK